MKLLCDNRQTCTGRALLCKTWRRCDIPQHLARASVQVPRVVVVVVVVEGGIIASHLLTQ